MLVPNFKLEEELYKGGCNLVCGMDEVGRGAWAGPLVVGAVILRTDRKIYKLRDSKVLTLEKREKIFPQILDYCLDYSIGQVSAQEIDKFGLSKAIKLAGRRCLLNLKIVPEIVLLDGRWNYLEEIETKTITKGDSKSVSIAAASIVAKVIRDRLLNIHHQKYPHYSFLKNKGYGTKEHQRALKKHGLSKIHRKSFNIQKYGRFQKENRGTGRGRSQKISRKK